MSVELIEQRRYLRVRPSGRVPRTGKLILNARDPAVDCYVVDISAGGACVEAHGATPIPERIVFLHSGIKKSARVAWRKGRRMGLQF